MLYPGNENDSKKMKIIFWKQGENTGFYDKVMKVLKLVTWCDQTYKNYIFALIFVFGV